jgi:hypothetical protein
LSAKSVPIPRHLENRPRFRGLPIPYIALIKPDGQPDFRVTDEEARREVIQNRRCQLCSEALGKYIFFVGGTEAAKHNQYFEPAAHLDCLVYAMQVCPFIIGRIEHADPDKIQEQMPMGYQVHVSKAYTVVKNPYWVIKKATGYDLLAVAPNEIIVMPKDIIYQTPPLHAESMGAEEWEAITDILLRAQQPEKGGGNESDTR